MRNRLRRLFLTLALLASIFSFTESKAITIFPVATNGSISQAGVNAAFGGSNYLVGIQGDAVAHYNITAQLISTNGALIGSRIAIGRTGGNPYVAFGGTNFLVVWPDDQLQSTGGFDQIYGQFVNRSGTLVGSPFTFGPTNESQDFQGIEPLAFDGKNYLVVWDTSLSSSNAPNGDVHGALFSPTGSLVVPAIAITSGAIAALAPAVAFGKTNYLVVWNNRRAVSTELYDIYGQFISTNGTQGSPFAISQTPTPRYNPCCAAFDGTNFFVVWNKDLSAGYPTPVNWNLYNRLVSPAGTFSGNELAMVTDTNNPTFPFLAFDGANYLMSWHAGNTNSQIFYQFFNPAGVALGPEFNLFAPQGTNAPIFGGVCYGNGQLGAIGIIGGFGGGNFTSGTATYGAFIPASTAAPTFAKTNSLAGAQFSLRLSGTPGINYKIQAATNLASPAWTDLTTNSPTNGTFTFTDTHATNKSRFYRAMK